MLPFIFYRAMLC